MHTIAVLGAGSWGTALALQLARNQHRVFLWGHRAAHIEQLIADGANHKYLPDVFFPKNLIPTADLAAAVASAEMVLAVVPSIGFAGLLSDLKPLLGKKPFMWAIKGFEQGSGRLLSDVFTEYFGKHHAHAILAGPSFAREVAAGKPTAVTIAAAHKNDAPAFAEPFHSSNFLCYTSDDLIGAQIGGAVKNVIAIAVGIADGLRCGANTRAALITRGLQEMTRLATALGAQAQTLSGLTGLGDLVLTATDDQSRNRRFGLALGQGKTALEAKALIGQVIEGEGAAHDTWALACRYQVRMPITQYMHQFLNGEIDIQTAVMHLSNRDLKAESA